MADSSLRSSLPNLLSRRRGASARRRPVTAAALLLLLMPGHAGLLAQVARPAVPPATQAYTLGAGDFVQVTV